MFFIHRHASLLTHLTLLVVLRANNSLTRATHNSGQQLTRKNKSQFKANNSLTRTTHSREQLTRKNKSQVRANNSFTTTTHSQDKLATHNSRPTTHSQEKLATHNSKPTTHSQEQLTHKNNSLTRTTHSQEQVTIQGQQFTHNKNSQLTTQGQQLKEAQNINKSLSALGDCIQSLVAKSKHIPFRNSKLTFFLQDSLGGDSKVRVSALLCAMSKETYIVCKCGKRPLYESYKSVLLCQKRGTGLCQKRRTSHVYGERDLYTSHTQESL